MKTTPLAQTLFVAGGAWLIISGIGELMTASQGNEYGTWFEETSLMALNRRSQGSLKIGLGLGLLGAASLSNTSTGSNTLSPKSRPSDGTSEGDFIACFRLYRDKGGTEEAEFSKTSTRGKTLLLCDQSGKRIAVFVKKWNGEWYMTGKY